MIRTAQDEALAYAVSLDRALAGGADGAAHDALMEVGELCGGLSERGFAADLRSWLEDEDEGVLVGWDWSHRPEDMARWWLNRAREEMARAEPERRAA